MGGISLHLFSLLTQCSQVPMGSEILAMEANVPFHPPSSLPTNEARLNQQSMKTSCCCHKTILGLELPLTLLLHCMGATAQARLLTRMLKKIVETWKRNSAGKRNFNTAFIDSICKPTKNRDLSTKGSCSGFCHLSDIVFYLFHAKVHVGLNKFSLMVGKLSQSI